MKNIFKALNVTSEMELNKLVESLDLEINDYINFMSMLNETLEPQTIRDNLLQLTESLYNGSYEKLQEQISKKPFVRKLKEETVYDHSWYEVKKQKYPKRTKSGVEIKEGIKDWFKKDNKQYRIEMDSNGAYLSKDKKHIVGDKNDALIISGYKKALKLAKWLNNYEGTTIYHPVEVKDSLNENSSNESEYKVGQKLMYKKNGTTYVIDKVNGKYYDIKDSYSNKVYPVYKNTIDSEFKLLKESLEDEEVKNDTTEIKEPKQKSSSDPEISQFITTTEKVVNNTTNPDILQGILDSIDVKMALAVDVEQANKLGELKQKTETKLVSAHKIDQISESFDYDNYVPNFHIGDNVEFYWGDKKHTGRVVEVKDRGTYELYNIISYNTETEKEETFVNVEPDDNLMKKISDDYEFEEYDDDYEFEEYDDLEETCSAGATCAANVSGFAKPIGTTIKRNKKKVKESFDSKLFKESILNDMECSSKINGKQLRYFLNEGKYYLSVDNALVKSFDKAVMIETVNEILYDEDISYKLLEGYSCFEMNILMEDDTITPIVSSNSTDEELNEPKDTEELEYENDLKNDIGNSSKKVSAQSPEDENKMEDDQQLIGYDEELKQFILKGPDGKTMYSDSRNIKQVNESVLTEGIADVAKYFPKMDIESIKEVIKLDPTYNGGEQLGKYGKWILKLVYNNVKNNENRQNFQNLMKQYPDGINPKNGQPFQAPKLLPDITNEDRYKLTQSLKKYDMFKGEIGKAIDAFKTLPELDAAISEVEERGVPAHKLARQRLGIFKNAMKKGLKKVYEDGKWIVGIPETLESSKMFGDETSWCTTSNGGYYEDYSSQGPLFINLNKDNGRLYQFHFQSGSFMDEHDSTRRWEDGGDINGFFSENPFLEHFYKDYVRHEEEDPKKIVESIVNNRDRLGDIFDNVYNLTFDGNHITGTLDIEDIDTIYRDRDRNTVSLSFISKMLSGDWWDAFNGGDYDVGYDELKYSDSAFNSEIKKISKEGGIDLTKIKWSEIIHILRTDGDEETENFTEEEARELYVKMTNDFYDDMSIWNVFSDCKINGAANEAYNDIKSDLIDNLPLNPKEPFNNSDLNIYIPFEDLVGMCTDHSTVRVDIESDPIWYDRLCNDLDFSDGWLYKWYSSKFSTDSFGIYEPRYSWYGFDDSQWRYAISDFVHYIHTMKRGKRNENQ